MTAADVLQMALCHRTRPNNKPKRDGRFEPVPSRQSPGQSNGTLIRASLRANLSISASAIAPLSSSSRSRNLSITPGSSKEPRPAPALLADSSSIPSHFDNELPLSSDEPTLSRNRESAES